MALSQLLVVLVLVGFASAPVAAKDSAANHANPIRKVVSMLQMMQKKVTEEGEKEAELYKKFMCYCKTSGADLTGSISAADSKSASLGTDITTSVEQKAQNEEALKKAQSDRAAAKEAIAEATAIREKEAAAFAKEKAMSVANIDALIKAIAALEKGVAGAFLQSGSAQVLRKLMLDKTDMLDADRQDLLAFLSGTQGSEYVPQSGEITGILKQILDEMKKGLAEATADENEGIKGYEALMAAKRKEVAALTASVESKLQKIGELGVSIAQMRNELTDTEEAALADKEFFAGLEKGCKTKTAQWEEISKLRSEELVALAETIKVLNDDDALELFKKTLPSASSSFVQLGQRAAVLRARALAALKTALRSNPRDRPQMDLIALALHGKKIGFAKVIQMIDTMVATLKREQVDDDSKKEYCAKSFDMADDKKKALERLVSDTEGAIAVAEEGVATLKDDIKALEAGIKELDKSVAEATQLRKDEHDEFNALIASDSATKELLGFAKNRLNKYYNPKLYKPAPKVELSAGDRIFVSEGGTPPPTFASGIADTGIAVFAQVSAHIQRKDAPPPPPETFGAYEKKSAENTGVIGMINLLITDLDKEMAASTTSEKDAQADYEELMADSAKKRAADSSLLTEKTGTKASLEGDLDGHQDAKKSASRELRATLEYIGSLHAECDWLMQYFDVRKEARASEIDALGNAKAVLSGADYSLLQQTSARGFLSRSA